MDGSEASCHAGLEALRKESKRMERRIRQFERIARMSKVMARPSTSVMEQSLNGPRERTNDLEAAKDAAEAGLVAKVDGFLATSMIRGSGGPRGRVHIIALTALSMEGDRERCLAAGMDDYVQKPLRVAELQSALARSRAAYRDAG